MPESNDIKSSPTWIHGVGSSIAVDTAGEIVDLSGLDCSSLEGAPFSWEHQNIQPNQLVGKILEYKKIFSETDCENEHHKYFWNKCKNPFLYVMGRLFDDKKDSSKEVAALFIDDSEHPQEHPMVGLSVEGSKISKNGIIVDKSIARKVTITNCPANKQCIAELVPAKNSEKPDSDSIFKSEASYVIDLRKAEVPGSHIKPAHPSKGQNVSSPVAFAPGWSHTGEGNFSHPEHGTVSVLKQPSGEFHVKHNGAIAGVHGKKGTFGSAKEAGAHVGEYMRALSSGKTSAPKMQSHPSPSMMGKGSPVGEPLMKPYTSEAQRRWAHTSAGKEALGGEAAVHEWDEATKGKKLPEKVKKMAKALKFGTAEDQAHVDRKMAEMKNNPPKKAEPKKKEPKLTGPIESEVSHTETSIGHTPTGTHELDAVHLKSGHISHGHPKGKFKVGDKVTMKPHLMGTHLLEHKDKMQKSLTAGSGMASPGALVGGAALGRESLERKSQKANKLGKMEKAIYPAADPAKPGISQIGQAVREANIYKKPETQAKIKEAYPNIKKPPQEQAKWLADEATQRAKNVIREEKEPKTVSEPKHKLGGKEREKARETTKIMAASEKLARAEQEYQRWEKREAFEAFMAKNVPALTKTEIKVIGQTLALSKSLKNERKLEKLMAGSNISSYIQKSKK